MDLLAPEYQLDTHFVQTKDGYFLTLFRLKFRPTDNNNPEDSSAPGESVNANVTVTVEEDLKITEKSQCENLETKSKGPVLFVHGFLCSGDEWFANTPDGVLPYMLAKEGYDCWLGCQRGSRLTSPEPHVKYSYKDAKFWDFCVDEFGTYDVPAFIDYILEKTQYSSLSYIGHSLGTVALFICCSTYPEYTAKVKVMAALTPASSGNHNHNFFLTKVLLPFGLIFGKVRWLYRRSTFDRSALKTTKTFCPCLPKKGKQALANWTWKTSCKLAGVIGNKSLYQVEGRVSDLASRLPGRTSVKAGCHTMQARHAHKFQAYDHGRSANIKRYGQPTPPEYALEKVNVPIAIFTSDYDRLIPAQDVLDQSKKLPNVIFYKEIKEPKFDHVDFMLGKEAKKHVYEDIIDIFNKY